MGSHKLVKKNSEFLEAGLEKEIAKGWLSSLPEERALDIPKLDLAPLGIITHAGISAKW